MEKVLLMIESVKNGLRRFVLKMFRWTIHGLKRLNQLQIFDLRVIANIFKSIVESILHHVALNKW